MEIQSDKLPEIASSAAIAWEGSAVYVQCSIVLYIVREEVLVEVRSTWRRLVWIGCMYIRRGVPTFKFW
jgi:hypothetical protein